jgi:para-aminobenzoate synthetase component 2
MALAHAELPLLGVQFHPESVLTEGGYRLLANWLASVGDSDAVSRAESLHPLTRG